MMGHCSILEHLRSEAERRGLRAVGADTPEAPEVFALVREMPYARPDDHDLRTLIREWRGTCSGKHALLRAVYTEMGYHATLMACTQEIRTPSGPRAPRGDRAGVLHAGPIVDVHNYIILHSDYGDMIVDATWPLSYRARGLPVNEQFIWGQDMQLACVPLETFIVPDEADVHRHKVSLLKFLYTPEQLARREAFVAAMGRIGEAG